MLDTVSRRPFAPSSLVAEIAADRAEPEATRDHGESILLRRAVPFALLALVTVAAGVFAYVVLFSQFTVWDDEGYFLLALRAYTKSRGLYERIDTIYGPFYFELVGGVASLLHVAIDNVFARWFQLGVWIGSCLVLYRFVQRVTGSPFAGLLVYVLSFAILNSLATGPLHPGGLIDLLLSVALLCSLALEDPSKRSLALAACGACTAAIALTKLNAGAYTVVGVAAFFLRMAPRTRLGDVLRIASTGLLPLLPFCLMAPLIGQEGIRGYAVLVSLSLIPFGFLPRLEPRERLRKSVIAFVSGGLAMTAVVLVLCFLGGTKPGGLWRSLVVGSLSFPGVFVFPPRPSWSASLFALAAIPLGLGAIARWTTWLGETSRAFLKLAGGVILLVLCLTPPRAPMLGLPLVWVVAVSGKSSTRGLETRALLGSIVVWQALQAYPVAGIHLAFFTYLLPVVGVITVWDAFHELPMRVREASNRAPWKIAGTATVVLTLATCDATFALVPGVWARFKTGVPLGLKGAESIRLPEYRAAVLQWVTCNLRHHADTFVGFPGLHSFYGWTALDPPVPFYPHTWVLFFDDEEQEDLDRALLASRRPCIVRDRDVIDFWTMGRSMRDGPLVRSAEEEFRVIGAAGSYELLVPNAAPADLVLSAVPFPAPQELLDRHGAANAYRLAFPAMPGAHVARIVARDARQGIDLADSAAVPPERRLSIVSLDGADLLQGDPPALIDLSQRSDVIMLCPSTSPQLSSATGLVRAYGEQGRIVARLLLPR
jgi:hypothetical protein